MSLENDGGENGSDSNIDSSELMGPTPTTPVNLPTSVITYVITTVPTGTLEKRDSSMHSCVDCHAPIEGWSDTVHTYCTLAYKMGTCGNSTLIGLACGHTADIARRSTV